MSSYLTQTQYHNLTEVDLWRESEPKILAAILQLNLLFPTAETIKDFSEVSRVQKIKISLKTHFTYRGEAPERTPRIKK